MDLNLPMKIHLKQKIWLSLVHLLLKVYYQFYIQIKSLSIFLIYKGTCTGLVVRTGDRTVMGRIANLASSKINIFKLMFIEN